MKSIAVLGMIYLPATFVCVCHPIDRLDLDLLTADMQTFFSMGFFQWSGQSNNTTTVSPDLWIFALAAVTFTLLTVGVFLACTMNRGNKMGAKLHIV